MRAYASGYRAAPLARSMSRHSAGALMLFAAMQVWIIVVVSNVPGGKILPIVALALLLLIAIPFARRVERRWRDIAQSALPSPALDARYRRERLQLWILAVAVPMIWVGSYAALAKAATGTL